MRCADCGASNPDTADWCGGCYASLRAAEPAPEPQPAPEPAQPPAAPADATAPDGLRRRDGGLEWQCPGCGQWTSMQSLDCGACGVTIAAQGEWGDPAQVARRLSQPWGAALALTAVVPGAGHIGLGRYGPGFARALLFAVWVVGGVALWRARGALAGGPFVLGAGLLWAGALGDLAALRAGRREVLGGRWLLWLALGIVVLTVVGVATSTPASSAGVAA